MSIFNAVVGGLKVFDAIRGGGDKKSSGKQTSRTSQTGESKTSIEELLSAITERESRQQSTETATDTSNLNQRQKGSSSTTQGSVALGDEETTQRTLAFDDAVMANLNSLISSAIGTDNAFSVGQRAVTDRLNTLTEQPGFNIDDFVGGIMSRAESNMAGDLESGVNNIRSGLGGVTGETNSMAALLENRLRTDAASNLAGIEAEARARGMQTRAQESAELSGLAGSGADRLLGLIQSLAGADATTTGTAQTKMQEDTQRATETDSRTTADQKSKSTAKSSQTGSSKETTNTVGSSDQTQSSITDTRSDVRSKTKSKSDKDRLSSILDLLSQSSGAA